MEKINFSYRVPFLFAFGVLLLVFGNIMATQLYMDVFKGNPDIVDKGNSDTVLVESELCNVAVGKMLSAWDWNGDVANVQHHAIHDKEGEVVARTIIIYYTDPVQLKHMWDTENNSVGDGDGE